MNLRLLGPETASDSGSQANCTGLCVPPAGLVAPRRTPICRVKPGFFPTLSQPALLPFLVPKRIRVFSYLYSAVGGRPVTFAFACSWGEQIDTSLSSTCLVFWLLRHSRRGLGLPDHSESLGTKRIPERRRGMHDQFDDRTCIWNKDVVTVLAAPNRQASAIRHGTDGSRHVNHLKTSENDVRPLLVVKTRLPLPAKAAHLQFALKHGGSRVRGSVEKLDDPDTRRRRGSRPRPASTPR